jgi:hypothetical protein
VRLKSPALLLALAGLACSPTGPLAGVAPNRPLVQQQTFSAAAGSLERVALVPFYPRPELAAGAPGAATPEEVAGFVTSFLSDALAGQGVRLVSPSDVEAAFTALGRATPRRDPRAAAELAAREFGASAVVLGEVYRWRERGGQAMGSEVPASVGFELSLFDAQEGRRLWNGRFDHTQRTLTGDPMMARRYPGGGTRWLTVAELARWGAQAAAASLVEGQWRPSS